MPKDRLLFDEEHFARVAEEELYSRGRRRLWVAVLVQTIRDAYNPPAGLSGGGAIKARADAQAFLSNNNRDFREVCEMAGVDADHLRAMYIDGRLEEFAVAWHHSPTRRRVA